jgi:hypothetical protein
VTSFNTTEHRGILRHHGTECHPSTQRSSVASSNTTSSATYFNNTEQRCIHFRMVVVFVFVTLSTILCLLLSLKIPTVSRLGYNSTNFSNKNPPTPRAARHTSTIRSSVVSFNTKEQRGILQHQGAALHPSTPWSSVTSSNTTKQCGILQHHGAAWRMPRCSVVLKNVTLCCVFGGFDGAPRCRRMSRCSVELKILQHHGTVWHPSKPRSNMAFFNTTGQRGIIQHQGATLHPSTPRSSVASFNIQRCSLLLKYVILLRGVEGSHSATWG